MQRTIMDHRPASQRDSLERVDWLRFHEVVAPFLREGGSEPMTESEWLDSEDPQRMLQYLQAMRSAAGVGESPYPVPRTSDRKLRLFACACTRQVWHLLTDPRSRQAVDVAERFADGQATEKELAAARVAAWDAARVAARDAARVAAWDAAWDAARAAAWAAAWDAATYAASAAASAAQTSLLRDIVGNPWRPIVPARTICPECLGSGELTTSHRFTCYTCGGKGTVSPVNPWLTPDVRSLAQAAYEERDPASGHLDQVRLCIMADALEEVGCDSGDLLRHLRGLDRCPMCLGTGEGRLNDDRPEAPVGSWRVCDCGGKGWVRSPGPHVRGCWALDLIRGKE